MKIVHINTTDCRGGAAKVAFRLHTELRKSGYDSNMLVGWKYSNGNGIKAMHKDDFLNRAHRTIARKLEEYTGFQYFLRNPLRRTLRFRDIEEADVIHLHNVHGGYLNMWNIGSLVVDKPVIWTLHDMWPITGHCSHSFDCDKWIEGCGKCPRLSVYPRIRADRSAFLWRFKRDAFRDTSPLIVTPSEWLKEKIPKSILSHCKVRVVNNAVDDSVFHEIPEEKARRELGLSAEDFVLLFAAEGGYKNPWKGFSYAVEALKSISNSEKKIILICLGNRKESENLIQRNVKIRNVRYVSSESLMRSYYSAANAYLLPSVAENSPLGVLESFACGTPVIAFDTGGVPELIEHLKTGYVAKYRSAEDLANGIKWFSSLSADMFGDISTECVQHVEQRFTLQLQMRKYLDAYQEAIV